MYSFKQPDGANIDITIYWESMSGYGEKDFLENPSLKGILTANVHKYYDLGHARSLIDRNFDKRFYFDNKGVYTYKKQKTPIFFWKVTNNEPRLLKKNVF